MKLNKLFKRLSATVMALTLSASLFPINAFAHTELSQSDLPDAEDTAYVSPVEICAPDEVVTADADSYAPLELTVDIPNNIKCNEPATFTLYATGGYGNYLYRFGSMYYLDSNGTRVDDRNYTVAGHTESNTFDVVFPAPATYYLEFNVLARLMDENGVTQKAEYTVSRVPVTVTDTSVLSVDEVVRKIGEEAKAKYPNDKYNQMVYCHDYIINNAEYNNDYIGPNGVLIRGEGNCESYQSAFKLLMDYLGIPCERIANYTMMHAWNCVKINGVWAMIDVTWDDSPGYEHLYFGLTDELLSRSHTAHTPISGLECNSLSQHYYIRSGEIRNYSDPITNEIDRKLAAGDIDFSVNVRHYHPRVVDILYPIVEYYLNEYVYKNSDISVKYTYNMDMTSYQYTGSFTVSKKTSTSTSASTTATTATTKTTVPTTKPTAVSYDTTVVLSGTKLAYTGKVVKPAVTVYDGNGNIVPSSNYSLSYSSGSKKIGTYSVKVTFKAPYSGTKTLSYKIVPKTPSSLSVSGQTTSGMKVKWSKVTGASKYYVYYSANGTTWSKKTVSKNNVTLSKLSAGKEYKIKVVAVDSSKKYLSGESAVLTTATKCKAPSVKVSSPEKKTALITWGKVSGACYYNVYYSTKKTSGFKKLAVVTDPSFICDTFASGKTYYFKVTAVRAAGCKALASAYSAVKSVKIK